MSYNKFIKSGTNFELYEYEYKGESRGRPKGYKVAFNRNDLDKDRRDTLSQRKLAKRRDNAQRARMAFRRLVLANFTTSENPLFITCTIGENETDVSKCARFFHLFTQRMRKRYGSEFRYVAVIEFQERGAVHYHCLFWGLPASVSIEERRLRTVAGLWKKGFVDVVMTDGNEKLAGYMAKYMSKALNDSRLLYHKAYFGSRNLLRPVVEKGLPLWWIQDEYELSTVEPLHSVEFLTQWNGKGRYTNYKLNQ